MALESYNETVSLFETNFKPLMSNVQQSDKENIHMMKSKLENFARNLGTFGSEMCRNSDDLVDAAKHIDADVDLSIFIESNKSKAPFAPRAQFIPYEEIEKPIESKSAEQLKESLKDSLSPEQQFKSELPPIKIDHGPGSQTYERTGESPQLNDFEVVNPETNLDSDYDLIYQAFKGMIYDS